MLVLAIVCLAIGFANANHPAGTCGIRPVANRIVNGTVAKEGDWPWMCSMLFNGRHICGGSLMNEQWIVTAAHCVSDLTASKYQMECGLHHRNNKESWTRKFSVKRIIRNPNYSSLNMQNDIALMELTTPIYISGKNEYDDYISPVCIPTEHTSFKGEVSYATGWGTLSSGSSSLPTLLYEVALRTWDDTECRNYNYRVDPKTQVCAGGPNKDTCQGDSGGPLVYFNQATTSWELIGLTSWGFGCGGGGVYNRVQPYRSWIETTMGRPI